MSKVRKHNHHKVITISREMIRMIEDEWYERYNRNYNINTNKVG